MKCTQCNNEAIHDNQCADHTCEQIEQTVKQTIEQFKLLTPDQKLLVAASGGKDSQILIVILKKLGYTPDVLIIDEGIKDYRSHTKEALKKLCEELNRSRRRTVPRSALAGLGPPPG